jgi:hypothetical protein
LIAFSLSHVEHLVHDVEIAGPDSSGRLYAVVLTKSLEAAFDKIDGAAGPISRRADPEA